MKTNEISQAAAALGRKGGSTTSESKTIAARANGAKGGRRVRWFPPPKRGCKNPMQSAYRFTVVRLTDKFERFTNRKPRPEIFSDIDMMVWDNENNCKAR